MSKEMSKGILVVVSGFSGSGKGTVMKRLMEKYEIMHYPFLLPPEIQDQAKKTEKLISSAQKKNLNS